MAPLQFWFTSATIPMWVVVFSSLAALVGASYGVVQAIDKEWKDGVRQQSSEVLLTFAVRAEVMGNTAPSEAQLAGFVDDAKAFIEEVARGIAPILKPSEVAEVMANEPSSQQFTGNPLVSNYRNRLLDIARKLRALANAYS